MEIQSRVPELDELSFDGALMWFSRLQFADLLFHPEDDPDTIFSNRSGEKTFSPTEVIELRQILDQLDLAIGHDKTIEAAYPIFMNAFGSRLDS